MCKISQVVISDFLLLKIPLYWSVEFEKCGILRGGFSCSISAVAKTTTYTPKLFSGILTNYKAKTIDISNREVLSQISLCELY